MANDPIQFNVSKRTSRKENAEDFCAGIQQFQETLMENAAVVSGATLPPSTFNVYIRKRPIFVHEIEAGEYDTVTCVGQQAAVAHKCNMQADLRHMYITHRRHRVHRVFDENATNSEVYTVAAEPLLRAMSEGRNATLLMFGQTGSGKSYTMNGICKNAAQRLFQDLPAGVQLLAACFELVGSHCFDLLNNHSQLLLREDGSGELNVCGLTQMAIQSPEHLVQWVQMTQKIRASHATTINAVSSRSHCFTKLSYCPSSDYSGPTAHNLARVLKGTLTLVDLAGSERNEDSFYHDAERRKESAFINASLSVLKQCIRLQTSGNHSGHVPYRQSELTRLLKDAFVSPHAVSAVIATVSPIATDTEHSMDTLHHATLMASTENQTKSTDQEVPIGLAKMLEFGADAVELQRAVPPVRWTKNDVQEWLHRVSHGRAYLPSGIDGQQLVRMSRARFVQACNNDAELGGEIFNALQNEIKSVNQKKGADAKASRSAQCEHKRMTAARAAGMGRPAPAAVRA